MTEQTKLNPVQAAYNLLAEHEKTFDSITNNEEYDAYFKTKHELAVNVWRAVAEEIKDNNPGIEDDIERGHYDKWYLFDSTKCFVDTRWQIFPKGTRCAQCGEIHHLPTEKSYGCGLSMRIIPPAEDDTQYEWAVFDTKTESVIEFGAEDSHLEAFEMCEEVVEDLAGK